MARRQKAITGLTSELSAQLRFAKDPNLIVFTPVGGLGPVDIVTLNMTTGEYTAYDVKSKNYRKKDSYVAPDGYKRNLKGTFISVRISSIALNNVFILSAQIASCLDIL